MNKEFLPYREVRDNSLRLAHRIYADGFIPDVIYVSLRGGAYVGNVVSEYFKIVRGDKRPVFYAAVVARSYTDVRQQGAVRVDGWTYDPEHLRQGDQVLLIDDIFDTGRTVNYLVDVIMSKGVLPDEIKVAVHDYKIRVYSPQHPTVVPDYYCRRHVIEKPEDDFWIHYGSHELVGLSREEREAHYLSDDEELQDVFETLFG